MKILIIVSVLLGELLAQNKFNPELERKKNSILFQKMDVTSSVSFQSKQTSSTVTNKDSSIYQKTFFPDERIFPKFLADGTAQQFSLNKNAYTRRWIGSIGGIQRFYELRYGDIIFQIGLGATVYASLIRRPDMLEVQTACFFVDVPIEIKLSEKLSLRTGYGHYSAHLVDDGIEALKITAINYAKDFVPFFAAYKLCFINGFVYGGLRFDTYTIPEYNKRWNFQFGGEGGNIEIIDGLRIYGAMDIKLKSEVNYASTQSYQIGVKFLEQNSHAIRIAYTYRTGIEDRGQFYKDKTDLSLFGIFFDY
ncbi:MAG: DUF1207 domain-containing protein [Ignavibacteriales bacterium]|nr:DUF1207 domain-containing protein [Ignavibacteriales bacterium]